MDLDPSRLVLRQNALARGFSDSDVRSLYTRGGAQRLGHGAYMDEAGFGALDRVARHRVMIEAVMPSLSVDAAVSHQSAAVLYDWPLWAVDLDRVHVTRDRPNGGRIRPDTTVHCARLLDGRVHTVGGFVATGPERTLVDLARSVPFEQAVVAGDHALRSGAIDLESLVAEQELAKRRRGISAARRAIGFMDPSSDSVGESRSRVLFHRNGIPAPQLQVEIGAWRVDFLWGDVIGEFDGRVKYSRYLRPGQHPSDVVFEEKKREDALRALGFRVVRWTWDDLAHPDALLGRLRAALG
ncbi:MAG: hypothetical protein WBF79_17620 [Rhodococcus sp. (in: high G+C Gram-positive bacteria)]